MTASGLRRLGNAVVIAMAVVSAFVATESCLSRENTLHNNGRWTSAKINTARSVMGAIAFVKTRTALSKNRLNLGAWHGYQEVRLKEPLDISEVSVDLRSEYGGYCTFLHDVGPDGFHGLRLSLNPSHPSALLEGSSDGGFRSRIAIPHAALREGWHRLHVIFKERKAIFQLDDQFLAEAISAEGTRQIIGFRGGAVPCLVDNVHIRQVNGKTVHESFSNHRGYASVFAAFAMAIAIVNAIALVIWWNLRIHPFLANAIVLASVSTFYAADWFVLSARYPIDLVVANGYPTHGEPTEEIRLRLKRTCDQPSRPGVRRILFLGSSQTWGAGAARLEDMFVNRIQAQIRSERSDVEFVNAAISGENSASLVAFYERDWLCLRPALVVVNLGNNDAVAERLGENIEKLASLNEANQTRTILMLEANSTDVRTEPRLLRNHRAMAAVGARHQLPVIDMHSLIAPRQDDGFLWWDKVHLTSYGNRLVAEALMDHLRSAINALPPNSSPHP